MQKSYQKTYNKLVRDRIPEIIQQDGYTYRIETLNEQEFQQALREKILEEAHEIVEAGPDELVTELADLSEVLDTLMQLHNISHADVRTQQVERQQTRGGFTQRIRLLDISR
jgi:predicted house-cleaning noncanonical NTP pyrophosphatase (MazG superfamily)